MDHQGAGRRSAADTRRQPPWPSLEGPDGSAGSGGPENGSAGLENSGPVGTGPMPARSPGYGAPGYGTGGYSTGGYRPAGSGPQPVLGSGTGPQPVLGSGSGAQPVLGARHGLRPGTGPRPLLSSTSGQHQVLQGGSGAWPVMGPGSGAQPTLGAPAPAEDTYPGDDTYRTGPLAPPDGTGQFAPPDGTGQFAAPGRRRGGRTKRRFRSRTWLAAAAVLAVAAGLVSYKFLYEPTVNAPVPPTLRLPTTAPGSPDFDKTLGKWQHIGTRTEDPEPLTITGLYPPQFVLNGSSYVRTAASVTKTCSLAVYGADLQAALQSGHCTQVLRASYISGDGTMMGTVGVVNLISSSAAQKAGQVTGPQEIIAPLSSRKGATSKLGRGTGIVQAKIKGHYLILMWAEFTSLKSPSGSAQRQALEQFAANLVTGSANINLSTRMLTGKH